MADHVTANPGSGGATFAADDVGGIHYPRFKVDLGGDGLASPLVRGQLANATSLPVALSTEQETILDAIKTAVEGTLTVGAHAVTNAGVFAVQVDGAALTALQLIDDAIATDDAAFTPGTSKVMMAGFEFDDTAPDTVDEGDAGAARMSANRNIYTQIRDGEGNERGAYVDASGRLKVDGSGVTQPISAVSLPLPSGAATAANQTTIIGHVDGIEALLTAIDADTSELGAIKAALEIIDDWDETNRAAVNLIAGQAGVAGGSGLVGASTQRVTLATDVPLPAGDNNIGNVDIVSSALPTGAATEATLDAVKTAVELIDNAISGTEMQVDVLTLPGVAGDVAHDGADSGNPIKVGLRAIAHGANPTAVAAADRTNWYANRHGVGFVIGGHPNTQTWTYNTTAAQTDDNIMAAIATGTKYVITSILITVDESVTVGVGVRIGFGSTTVPALGASGADAVAGILVYHPGMVPGSGISRGDGSGIIGIGGDGEELRITCDAPTSGTLGVVVTGYTIES